MPKELHDAAVRYVTELGWFVFPIRPREKQPLTEHGLNDSSNDPAQVALWWNQHQNANIGIDCGKSGIAVVDLDGEEGINQWNAIVETGVLGSFMTLCQYTGNNGAHLIFSQTEPPVKNSVGKIAPRIDTRGVGGYILAAPSIHPNGNSYEWSEYTDFSIAPFPQHLLSLLNQAPTMPNIPLPPPNKDANVDRILTRAYERVASAAVGSRNDTLNKAAFYLGRFVLEGRLSESEVRQTLLYAAARAGLPERESAATILSGLHGAAKAGV
jgi:hypothetical protein